MTVGTDIIPHTGAEAFRVSTDAASMCKQLVVATAMQIKGRKYVRVEGWQAIAIAHGCTASASDVQRTDTGFKAIGKITRMVDGMVIATAEGFVGDDEPMWASRPEYARRAMAQTRAISRAGRSAFAHVVVMMQAGLETTPAEEIPIEGEVVSAANRDAELAKLCKAADVAPADILKRAGVSSANEMSDEDWNAAVGILREKAQRVTRKAAA